MPEYDPFDPTNPELLKGITLTKRPVDGAKRYDIVEDLRTSTEEARQRMHLHSLQTLSAQAIHSKYPNLIKAVHYNQETVFDPRTNTTIEMAAFSLWTPDGHVMMADGSLARKPGAQHDYKPEEYDTLLTVHDHEIRGYTPYLQTALVKAAKNLATTMTVRAGRVWTDAPVSEALLRG